jgi:hypothetical protein
MLIATLGEKLHADTDAEKRTTALSDGSRYGFDQAGYGGKSGHAIGERADTRQHEPIGACNRLRIRGDDNVDALAALGGGAGERAFRRAQIAGAVIDEGVGW